MRLLILGGTAFLGRAVARHAHALGHQVTCAARGHSGAPVDGVRFIAADRDADDGLAAVAEETFDAVVDVTRRPSHARRAVGDLAGRVGHWTFVSSISVYADSATVGQRADTAEVLPPAPADVDDPSGEQQRFYGHCKVSCEQHVRQEVGSERSFICRAGLIVGPEDPSWRFPYWVDRLARGGEVLAPGSPDDVVQVIDVLDLAHWLVDAGTQGLTGTFDAVGAPLPRGEFLARTAAGVGSAPTLVWVDQQFLLDQRVRPWQGERSLPLWVPLPDYAGQMSRDAGPAVAAGLTTRPLEQIAADTWQWLGTRGPTGGAGLTAEEEADLLRVWRLA